MAYPTYCTQLGPDGSGGYRCGAACLASALLDEGWESDPWELTLKISQEEGWEGVGCTSDQLISAAQARGLAGRKWVYWEELEQGVAQGEAVMVLCQNQFLIPRPYPMAYGWEALHWIRTLAVALRDDTCYCYDPLCYMVQKDGSPYQGPTVCTEETLVHAIQTNGWPEAGVILTSGSGVNLNR
jgi:hypothetical protein